MSFDNSVYLRKRAFFVETQRKFALASKQIYLCYATNIR